MMVTLSNSFSEINEFKDETNRLNGDMEVNGGPDLSLSTMRPRAKSRAGAHGAGGLVGR